jgi:CheY-like chemotaxis protein
MIKGDYRLETQYFFSKILIVEDVKYTKRLLKKSFEDIGYFVLTASNGAEAINKIEKYSPDILTFSHSMPDIALSPFIKVIKSKSKIKILYISSRIDEEILNDEISEFIDSIIYMPINQPDLEVVVSNMLNN